MDKLLVQRDYPWHNFELINHPFIVFHKSLMKNFSRNIHWELADVILFKGINFKTIRRKL